MGAVDSPAGIFFSRLVGDVNDLTKKVVHTELNVLQGARHTDQGRFLGTIEENEA